MTDPLARRPGPPRLETVDAANVRRIVETAAARKLCFTLRSLSNLARYGWTEDDACEALARRGDDDNRAVGTPPRICYVFFLPYDPGSRFQLAALVEPRGDGFVAKLELQEVALLDEGA